MYIYTLNKKYMEYASTKLCVSFLQFLLNVYNMNLFLVEFCKL